MQNTPFSRNKTLNVNGRLINLTTPAVMGIVNLTPDSFFSGSRAMENHEVLKRVEAMLAEGATFIDLGGYSSRPGATDIPVSEEIRRTVGIVRAVVRTFPSAIVSIDTFRAEVAKACVEAGASMINDISGGALDEEMLPTVASLRVPYVMMHMRGTPQTMAQQAAYNNLVKELLDFFHPRMDALRRAGVVDVVIDPGFGFAKTREHNFELLNQLDTLSLLGRPVLVGLSRKSLIWKTLDIDAEEALNGSTVLHTIALLKGADILRVHDVREAVEAVQLVEAMKRAGRTSEISGNNG